MLGVGSIAWYLSSRCAGPYTRGLIAGDSMVASPVLTQGLTSLTGIPWDNVAVVGRTSGAILRQLQQSLRPGVHRVVVVSAGGNDGPGALESTKRNLQAISDLVRAGGADLVLLTEPPFRRYRGVSAAGIERSEASRRWVLRGGAPARHVVDLHRILGRGTAYLRRDYDGGDGVHPNRTGRMAIAREIHGRIRGCVQRP
jgi:lysophospholipase L1-like esterase